MPVPERGTQRFRRFVAVSLTLLLAAAGLTATAPAAYADTPGINISVLHNGSVLADGAIVPEGDPLLLRMQYNAAEAIDGTVITISLPGNVSLAADLPGNEAIDAVVNNGDGTLTIRFKDPIPTDVTEGALGIELKAANVDGGDQDAPITWQIGEDHGGVTLRVEDRVVPPVVVKDGQKKSVNRSNLDSFVLVTQDSEGNYSFAGLDAAIDDQVLTYTLELNSAEARSDYSIADTLPASLAYVPGSFEAFLTTYNPEETVSHAFTPTVEAHSFAGQVSVPANSSLRIVYQVKVMDRALLESELRTQFEKLAGSAGTFQVTLTNTATFGGETVKNAGVRLRGTVPGVGVGSAFAKDGSWTHREVSAGEDGVLAPPAEITYTFHANLTLWDERNANFTLGRNVVISDTLPAQAEWKTAGSDFIVADGISLSAAGACPATVADFAGNDFVGQWCVDGQTLLINVGRAKTTNAVISAKAQLNTVAGLEEKGNTTILGGTSYRLRNTAEFTYGAGKTYAARHDAYPVVLPEDREGGINDSAVFTKTGPDSDVRVTPGEVAEVPYRFTIDTGKNGIDPLNSKLVDEINTEVFDLSDVQSIPVSGAYGALTLSAEHFVMSVDAENRLVIELSALGKTAVGGAEAGQRWTIDLVLSTVPLNGKQTLEIYNKATLYGSDGKPNYWDDDDAEATSYGDEAELRKRLYDSVSGKWVAELDAQLENGALVNDTFVYSIELIPRGNYGTNFPVQTFTRHDVLPAAVDFLGFVTLDGEGAPVVDALSSAPYAMNGNVIATYEDGVVTVQQADGTNLDPRNGRIVTYFAVQATDASADIVNQIVGSQATIKPYGDPSIDIEKWNDEGAAPEYDESGVLLNDGFDGDFDEAPGKQLTAGEAMPINFTVSNDGREDLVQVVVSDQLTAGTGAIEQLSCVFPDGETGTEWGGPFLVGTQFECTGLMPAIDLGGVHADTAKVTGVGAISGTNVADSDDWHALLAKPEPKPAPGNGGLAITGGAVMPGVLLTALLLMLGGGGALLLKRRRSGADQ